MVTIDLRLINYKCSIDTYHKMSPDIFCLHLLKHENAMLLFYLLYTEYLF